MRPPRIALEALPLRRRYGSSPEARVLKRLVVGFPAGGLEGGPVFWTACKRLGIRQVESPHPGFEFVDRGVKVVSGCMEVALDGSAHLGLELAALEMEAGRLRRLGAGVLVLSITAPGADRRLWVGVVDAVAKAVGTARRQRLALALRPQVGSAVQDAQTLGRLLVHSEAGFSLDLPQLLRMGVDPMDLVELSSDRIIHVRLPPWGPDGPDSAIAPVIQELRRRGYAGRYVIDRPDPGVGQEDLAAWVRLLAASE